VINVLIVGVILLRTPLVPIASDQGAAPILDADSAKKVGVFIESLATNNANLIIDRGDVVLSKGKSRDRNRLLTDIHEMRKLVDFFSEKELLQIDSDPKEGSPAQRMGMALQNLSVSLLAVEVAVGNSMMPASDAKRLSMAWADCSTAVQKVVGAAVKVPGFSLTDLSAPALYNLAPGLYEGREGMILADPKSPDRARVGRTFGDAGLKLKKGDAIVALRVSDEKEWTAINTWKDIVSEDEKAEVDGDDEALTIVLRVKRGRAFLDIPARFVKRRIEWE
jgi:hypothetical protein